ncbi:MAG: 2-C-methyl-D-erythritol 2,4-cyclodiphosphate synthase [Gemmatimonadaceae bacterium]
MIRTGIGYDSHRFAPGGNMILGGVKVANGIHLIGHSDGDAVAHAVTDALLGAAGAGDIGAIFPNTDPANKGRDSIEMLEHAVILINELGYGVVNIDVTVITEHPTIRPHVQAIREALAVAIGAEPDAVSVKGKSNEGMGWIGGGEGLACIAVASIGLIPDEPEE